MILPRLWIRNIVSALWEVRTMIAETFIWKSQSSKIKVHLEGTFNKLKRWRQFIVQIILAILKSSCLIKPTGYQLLKEKLELKSQVIGN
jgi:hypothetical protein